MPTLKCNLSPLAHRRSDREDIKDITWMASAKIIGDMRFLENFSSHVNIKSLVNELSTLFLGVQGLIGQDSELVQVRN